MVDSLELKKLRCSKGFFSQQAFADALGMSRMAYANRERGKTKFTTAEILAACSVLGISLEDGLKIML